MASKRFHSTDTNMLNDVTTLYENCGSTQITLHSISNPELKRISQKYSNLRQEAINLENSESLLPWTAFIRRLLFAWSYSPLSFEISTIKAIQSDYDRVSSDWILKKENFQESIKIGVDEILEGIQHITSSNISLSRGHSELTDLYFDEIYVCQKHWGWGIDNDRLSDLSRIEKLTHAAPGGILAERACFFGSPRIYALKGLSGIWTAPRFKEIHFIIHDYTGLKIPGWKSNSIKFDLPSNSNSPWDNRTTNEILIPAPNPQETVDQLDHDELFTNKSGTDALINNLNNQHDPQPNENEVFCVLLLTENGKVIPIRQNSKPDCLILESRITYKSVEAEELSSGDIILIRSSSVHTLREVESSQHDKTWEEALSLHWEWKEALSKITEVGLVSEVKKAVNHTAQNIRNWATPENHGPDRKETFVALMNHLKLNKDTDKKWKTIQALRARGHSIGADATETLKANFLKLDSSEKTTLARDGELKKHLNGDSEAASMTAIRISEVLTYSAKIRPSLINHILISDNIPWL